MKGGLMALVITLIELKEQDQLPQGTIRLLATAGERKNKKVPNYWLIKAI